MSVLPRGACDCHAHVFGPGLRFPYAEPRSYTPEDARTVALDPFPFDCRPCLVQMTAKRLPEPAYAARADFIAAYFKAPVGLPLGRRRELCQRMEVKLSDA